jgi:hypothetical protein
MADVFDRIHALVSPPPGGGDVFDRIHALVSPPPVAYSRITHSPISVEDQPGLKGTYKGGAITISPEQWGIVPHESAHQIYDKAGLAAQAPQLAPQVSEANRNLIAATPVYRQGPNAGTPDQVANEGLGFSIGQPTETDYVEKVASAIKDPVLATRLRRLNSNALGARNAKLWGIDQ